MRPLARYHGSQAEHEVFVEGLLLEARLRARILVRLTWLLFHLPAGAAAEGPQALFCCSVAPGKLCRSLSVYLAVGTLLIACTACCGTRMF